MPEKLHILFYEYVEDVVERRAPHREGHLGLIKRWHDEGRIAMAGGVGDPPHAGLIVLREEDPDAARAAAEAVRGRGPLPAGGPRDELARRALPQRDRLTGSVRRGLHHAASVPRSSRQPATSLRAWQERALVAMRSWGDGPFLVAAAPGAGKTRPALEHARALLKAGVVRRVAVVCPTTPLTRQWARAAARLGVHLVPDASELRPPRDFDGVAVTYARVASVAERWAGAVRRRDARHRRRGPPPRRGARLGPGLRARLRRDAAVAAALGHALPLRPVPDPRRALRRRRRDARRLLQLRRRGPRRDLPPGHLRPLRRRPAVAQRRGPRRVVLRRRGHRARGGPALPHGDLPRAGRRPAAHPRGGARAPGGGPRRRPPRRGRARRRRRRRARARGGAACCARRRVTSRPSSCTPRRARPRSSRPSRARPTAGSSRSTWSARASTSRACASASTRRRPRRRSSSARSSGASCARSPGARSTAAGSSCPPTRCLRAHAAEVERELRHVLRPPGEEDDGALDEARRAARERARRGGGLRPGGGRRRARSSRCSAAVPAPVAVAVVPVSNRRARRGDDARLRAPRPAARQAPPAGGRPAPQPGRQPRRDQPLAEPLVRRAPRRGRLDRAARAFDRAAPRPSLLQTVNHLSPMG